MQNESAHSFTANLHLAPATNTVSCMPMHTFPVVLVYCKGMSHTSTVDGNPVHVINTSLGSIKWKGCPEDTGLSSKACNCML